MKLKILWRTIYIFIALCLLTLFQGFTLTAPAFANTVPNYTVTRYVSSPSNAYNWGATAGQVATSNGPSNGMIILDFGQPQTWTANGTTVYGTYSFGSQYLSTDQIATAVENFLYGFWLNTPLNGPCIYVVIGTNNGGGTTNANHGSAWASMVKNVNSWISTNGYTSQETAYGGSDMEIHWNTSSNTLAWVNGYNNNASYYCIDYGDDAGGTNPAGDGKTSPDNTWTADNVYYKAYGAMYDYPVPEIYNSACASLDWGILVHGRKQIKDAI